MEGVVIAGINAPETVSISGDSAAVDAVCESCAKDGIRCKALRVSHAFHSPLMNEAAEKIRQGFKGKKLQNTRFGGFYLNSFRERGIPNDYRGRLLGGTNYASGEICRYRGAAPGKMRCSR